jgi:tRNA dimethylallyltransferase
LSLPRLIVIAGPTAVGKTALSLNLAEHFKCEIISADSRQFYREMEIGTAKPSAEELKRVPHHFINNLSIKDEYNVGKYEKEVLELLGNLYKKTGAAILAGGSGLFINAVCHGFDALPEADTRLRESYEKILQEKGIEPLQAELKEKDPEYYEEVDNKNPRRLIRALEVIHQTGMPYSQLRNKKNVKRNFSVIKIGINVEKEILVDRINKRIDEMLAKGWLDECKQLYPYRNLNALKTVGYTELFDFIDGKNDWETTVQQIKTNTWHYAKRQLTWFKKDKEIKWFSLNEEEKILAYIANFATS